jgi:purine-binding chemotaxis protein CheW
LLKILIFKLAEQEYGIDISKISTIIEKDMDVARVPKTPAYVDGVINLRGEILPVVNLRRRLGYEFIPYGDETRIIIVKSEDVCVGLVVDLVVEVVQVISENMEDAANVSKDLSSEDISGIYKTGGRVITLLNADRFLNLT